MHIHTHILVCLYKCILYANIGITTPFPCADILPFLGSLVLNAFINNMPIITTLYTYNITLNI